MRFILTLAALTLFSAPLFISPSPLPRIDNLTHNATTTPQPPTPSTAKPTTPAKEVVVSESRKEEPEESPTTTRQVPTLPPSVPVPPGTPASPPAVTDEASVLEEKIWAFTNNERTRREISSLVRNSILAATARAHSADMLERDYFDHENPDGCSSSCRATKAGYAWRMVGENIYMLEGFEFSTDQTAAMIVSGWMESPGHRANILKEGYTETGVGVIVQGSAIYATVLYATPPAAGISP